MSSTPEEPLQRGVVIRARMRNDGCRRAFKVRRVAE